MEDYSDIIAKNLIELRKSRELTQQDFAKILNYSDKTISKWELGYASPSVETLKQIADYYGVTVDYFLTEHDPLQVVGTPIMKKKIRRILVMLLFDLFFLLAAATIFAALATTEREHLIYWPVFFWAVSACLLFNSIVSNEWWKHTIAPYIFVSSTIWMILVSLYVTLIFQDVSYNFWYLFFLGLPIQFAAIIILSLSHSKSEK